MVEEFHRRTGLRKLRLAGGVALNCVANQKLMNLDCIDDLYIQPAAGDAGVALGAAMLLSAQLGVLPQPMENAYLGEAFTAAEIEEEIANSGLSYEVTDDPAGFAAEQVGQNRVVGWFQGRAEFGPRALGSRSILGNPTHPDMDDIINRKIKFRESFRPFCPSVLEEDAAQHFDGAQAISPYMTITYDVKPESRELLPAVTHVDGTARIQTVNETQNPLFYRYLQRLKDEIGCGVTLNTSFNRKDEPIVNTPRDAIATFYGSGLDALVIGNYVVTK
jgi:carbamoyltransferase